jgi:hypothetical protein
MKEPAGRCGECRAILFLITTSIPGVISEPTVSSSNKDDSYSQVYR